MAHKEDYSKMDGVWRTISGRRVFIKKGQSLTDAMKESGKFKDSKTKEIEKKINELNKIQQKYNEEANEIRKKYSKIFDDAVKNSDPEGQINSRKDMAREFNKLNQKEEYKDLRNRIATAHSEYSKTLSENIINSDIKKYISNYEFKNKDLEKDLKENFKNMNSYMINSIQDYADIEKSKKLLSSALMDIDKINAENDFEISKSPYSFSMYSIPKDEYVDWGYKPTGSYRLSDHWNFQSRGSTHCELSSTSEYTQKLILAKYNGKTYDIVKEYD